MQIRRHAGPIARSVLLACYLCGCSGDDGSRADELETPASGGSPSATAGGSSGYGSGGRSETGAGGSNQGAGGALAGGGQTTGAAAAGGQAGGAGGGFTDGPGGGGGAASCDAPAPPDEMKETLDLTWKEMTGGFEGKEGARPVSASIASFENTILDQIMAGEGKLKYCVRYESNTPVTSALRIEIEAAIERAINKWTAKLEGYACFPYPQVEVEVSGWATWARDTLQWDDDQTPIYIGQNDDSGAPRCPDECSRFVHREPGYSYPDCAGGAENHFDMSLWLTDDFGYVGGDWGQRLDHDYFVNSVDTDDQHIFSHEIGHGFGFPDYYNWSVWAPEVLAPACVMNAGAAARVTDWDGWMLRRTWSELRARW